jgi:hypothetical protein
VSAGIWMEACPASAPTGQVPEDLGQLQHRLALGQRHVRANQGRQGCDQVDAAVMPDVRRQRGPAPASCARLQSRQLPAHAGDAGTDQGLVADKPEGEADQDRREGRQPRPLRRIPDGRGRHPTENVPRDFASAERMRSLKARDETEVVDRAFKECEVPERRSDPCRGRQLESPHTQLA